MTFQISWNRGRGVSVTTDAKIEALGFLYGAALAASDAEPSLVRAMYDVRQRRSFSGGIFFHGEATFDVDTATLVCGPIHRAAMLRATHAAYAFLGIAMDARVRKS